MSNIDPRQLRNAFGSFLTGVTVVTAVDGDGKPYGFTANSFSSVSLDPPMLLVCPGRFLSSFPVFEQCQHFAVSILAEGQEAVSNTFAAFKGDRFAQVDWQPGPQGVPLIDGATAQFACKTAQVLPAGDHIILLGEVIQFAQSGARGLGYAAGRYFSLGLEREAAAAPPPGLRTVAGAIIEHQGKVLLEETPDGLCPPQIQLEARSRVRQTLQDALNQRGLEITLGKAYSLFDNRLSHTHYSYFLARTSNPAATGSGRFFPIAELPEARFISDAHARMLTRFALEYQSQDFGLYVGDESGGDIHSFDQRS